MTGRSYTFAFGALALDVSANSAAEAVNLLKADLQIGSIDASLGRLHSVTGARIGLRPDDVSEANIVDVYPPENPS